MRHINLFLAAAIVVFGSASALWAAHVPALPTPEFSTSDPGPAPAAVPVASTPAPAVVSAPTPVAETPVEPGTKGQPEEVSSGPAGQAEHLVAPQPRPIAHRLRTGCISARRHVAHTAKPAGIAARWASAWSAAAPGEPQCGANRCVQIVLLGVGY